MRTKSAENLQRPNGLARVGTLFQLRFLEHTGHHRVATRPERPSWHLWAQRHVMPLLQDFSNIKICAISALRNIPLYVTDRMLFIFSTRKSGKNSPHFGVIPYYITQKPL